MAHAWGPMLAPSSLLSLPFISLRVAGVWRAFVPSGFVRLLSIMIFGMGSGGDVDDRYPTVWHFSACWLW